MADVLKQGLNKSFSGGIKTPSQLSTISGPGVRTDNMVAAKKQDTLPVVGRKNRG